MSLPLSSLIFLYPSFGGLQRALGERTGSIIWWDLLLSPCSLLSGELGLPRLVMFSDMLCHTGFPWKDHAWAWGVPINFQGQTTRVAPCPYPEWRVGVGESRKLLFIELKEKEKRIGTRRRILLVVSWHGCRYCFERRALLVGTALHLHGCSHGKGMPGEATVAEYGGNCGY